MKKCFIHVVALTLALVLLTATDNFWAFSSRPASGVFDESQSLSNNDRVALEVLLSRARALGEDIAGAILTSVDGAVPRKYATDLFNAWGLGGQKRIGAFWYWWRCKIVPPS